MHVSHYGDYARLAPADGGCRLYCMCLLCPSAADLSTVKTIIEDTCRLGRKGTLTGNLEGHRSLLCRMGIIVSCVAFRCICRLSCNGFQSCLCGDVQPI